MASIIIDEIVPTKWRIRLRDADGKTREVEYRTGTPLQLDTIKAAADKRSDAVATKARSAKAEKPKSEKPERSKHADTDKPKAKANRAERSKSEDTDDKPAAKPPQVRRRKPEPGTGPGALVWEETEDDGVPGIRAAHERGAFKILHAGGDAFALFYEWNSGKYQTLTCGTIEALKQEAAQWTENGKLHAPRSNLGAEAAKVACAVPEAPTPPATHPTQPPAPPAVDPEKDKVLMQGFESTVQKLLAARKGSP